MTQNTPDNNSEDLLSSAMRSAPRRADARRNLAWILLAICAISIGVILASDPKVAEAITGEPPAPDEAQVETEAAQAPAAPGGTLSQATADGATSVSADNSGVSFFRKSLSAVGAVSTSARALLVPEDAPEPDRSASTQFVAPDSSQFPSFGSAPSGLKPVVSAMPQNRIPVRRAGQSN